MTDKNKKHPGATTVIYMYNPHRQGQLKDYANERWNYYSRVDTKDDSFSYYSTIMTLSTRPLL
eukprot:1249527-Amphidinium_carterae.1